MIKFVLGFAFTLDNRVALIRKARPFWQKDRLNGIGGHVEQTETVRDAMVREFSEETGVIIPDYRWRRVGGMIADDWACAVFTTMSSDVNRIRTMTDEYVILHPIDIPLSPRQAIENVPALIALCQMVGGPPSGTVPKFILDYREKPNVH